MIECDLNDGSLENVEAAARDTRIKFGGIFWDGLSIASPETQRLVPLVTF